MERSEVRECVNDCDNGQVHCWSPGGGCGWLPGPCELCGTCGDCLMLDLPEPQRKRQALYDIFANAEYMAESLDMGGISADVAAMERAASTARLAALDDIKPMLHDHADFLAAVFIRIQRGQFEAEHGEGSTSQVSQEEWEGTYDHLRNMIYCGAISSVTLLIETQRLAHATEDTHGRMA